jgi:asparagine synthase (glutamine-hydrolysing)
MCGIAGYHEFRNERRADRQILLRMLDKIKHRGAEGPEYFVENGTALAFRRLGIVDPVHGRQPMYNEDETIVLVCNGELYDYAEIRCALEERGHTLRSNCDVEVLAHLYEERELTFLRRLNGQFAFVLYDKRASKLILARDHAGICPLYYSIVDGTIIFASEIKAILAHPLAQREVDLAGLNQMFSLPALVSPTTMFRNIHSLPHGHYLTVQDSSVKLTKYWDLDYPENIAGADTTKEVDYYAETLRGLLQRAIARRLQADVSVGYYLSGGLDSSLIASTVASLSPCVTRHSFSISLPAHSYMSEAPYQRHLAQQLRSVHHEIALDIQDIGARIPAAVYHSECPLKETYNTASLALSESAHAASIPVVLSGEGADELFAGYPGYQFDFLRTKSVSSGGGAGTSIDDCNRKKLWGDSNIYYMDDTGEHNHVKTSLYSSAVRAYLDEQEPDALCIVDKARLIGRHPIHQRSYLDFVIRLSGHLLADHGDRMAMANTVEARYPFLDLDVIEFATRIPPALKFNGQTGKYVLKAAAHGLVPDTIIERQKFPFSTPGSPDLVRHDIGWINDVLHADVLRRQGYFDAAAVDRIRSRYSSPAFELLPAFDEDWLLLVLTFGLLLDSFQLPNLN